MAITVKVGSDTVTLEPVIKSITSKFVWGLAYPGNGTDSATEELVGHPLAQRKYYVPGQEAKAVFDAKSALAAGRGIWLSFKLPYSWTDTIAGKSDAWYKDLLTKLGTVGGNILFTIHHEPEGDEPDISKFWDAIKRLATFARPANVRFGPVVIGWNQFSGPQKGTMPTKWEHGDFVGWDVYCANGTAKNPTAKYWEIASTYLEKIAVQAKGYGVPWAIGEWGLSKDAYKNNVGAPGWLTRAYQYAINEGHCLGMFWFNSNLNSTTNISDGTPAWLLENGRLDEYVKIAKQASAMW